MKCGLLLTTQVLMWLVRSGPKRQKWPETPIIMLDTCTYDTLNIYIFSICLSSYVLRFLTLLDSPSIAAMVICFLDSYV